MFIRRTQQLLTHSLPFAMKYASVRSNKYPILTKDPGKRVLRGRGCSWLPETEDLPACLDKSVSHPHLSFFRCPLPLAEKKYITCFPAWIRFPFPITNTVHTPGFLRVSDCYTRNNTLKLLTGFGRNQHKQRSSPHPLRWRTEIWGVLLSLPKEQIPKGKKFALGYGGCNS